MKAVLLAAIEDARMHPLTYTRPKVMLPFANKPILEHLVMEIKEAGVTEFLIVIGYRGEIIRSYFGNGEKWGISIEYVTQMQQTGTGNAVRKVQERVGDRFLVLNGSTLIKATDIKQLVKAKEITINVARANNPSDLGVVEIEGNLVKQIREKEPVPSSQLVNAGSYMLTSAIFPAIEACPPSPRGVYDLTDALQYVIEGKRQKVRYNILEYWLRLDYPWKLIDANEVYLSMTDSSNLAQCDDNVTIKGPVTIGSGTQLRAGTYIEGPAMIGERCIVGPLSYLGPGTTIGNDCQICGTVEVKNSIIMNNTRISGNTYIENSIIGANCILGSGTKIAGSRVSGKSIVVAGINTGRKEFGAVIGDSVVTGVNTMVDAGTLIGNDSHIGHGALARGVILPNSRIM